MALLEDVTILMFPLISFQVSHLVRRDVDEWFDFYTLYDDVSDYLKRLIFAV